MCDTKSTTKNTSSDSDSIYKRQLTMHDLSCWENVLLDIRCEEEISIFGRIPGAIHCPFYIYCGDMMVENRGFFLFVRKLVRSKSKMRRLFVICATGLRSEIAAMMIKEDFPQLEIISCAGGVLDWKKQGNELIQQDE